MEAINHRGDQQDAEQGWQQQEGVRKGGPGSLDGCSAQVDFSSLCYSLHSLGVGP